MCGGGECKCVCESMCECVHVLCLGQEIESGEYVGILLQEVWAMCGEVCG